MFNSSTRFQTGPLGQASHILSNANQQALHDLKSATMASFTGIRVFAEIPKVFSESEVLTQLRSTVSSVGLQNVFKTLRLSKVQPSSEPAGVACAEIANSHPWKSSETFFENKTGFPEKDLASTEFKPEGETDTYEITFPLRPFCGRQKLLNARHNLQFSQLMQTRGFRYDRETEDRSLEKNKTKGRLSFLQRARHFFDQYKVQSKDSKEGAPKDGHDEAFLNSYSPEAQMAFRYGRERGMNQTGSGGKEVPMSPLGTIILGALGKAIIYAVSFSLFIYLLTSFFSSPKAEGKEGDVSAGLGTLSSASISPVNAEKVKVKFQDVKGCDEAKEELQDIVNFLKNQDRCRAMGARLPKGVLLVGKPGIGKTMLAKAVAGEASVPFFQLSGSEFDELFVGTGAKKVRQLFKEAKKVSPCVIFLDEIDSVGGKRTSSAMHPYANQTINQLLAEMDGFASDSGVIVIGATNKPGNLDKALLRPGRFDITVTVQLPDAKGRKEIIEHYLSRIKQHDKIDTENLARRTIGFSGAEIENMINQAALKAVIDKAPSVTKDHIEWAKDKVVMGLERKSKIPDAECNKNTAFHEAGHALVAYYTKDAAKIHKVTILARGPSLGHTAFTPTKEEYSQSRAQLLASMDTGMGGRVAEELEFGKENVSTGASADFSSATRIAEDMVMSYGMSEEVGVRTFHGQSDPDPRSIKVVDEAINKLLNESYERARKILADHRKELKLLADGLLEFETLDSDEVTLVIQTKSLNALRKKRRQEKEALNKLKKDVLQ